MGNKKGGDIKGAKYDGNMKYTLYDGQYMLGEKGAKYKGSYVMGNL